jgi:hypothetical protein
MTGAGCRVDWVPRVDGNPAAPYIQPVIPRGIGRDDLSAVTQGHIRTSDHLIPAEP